MKKFMDKDFLLKTETAKTLFHDAAKDMPIYDFHNHLEAKEIYDDLQYESITELWLGGDHYKWRQERTFGYTQDEILSKDKSDFEKFQMWANTVEASFGNPLYHWTHLELQRYFDIYEPLNSKNAKEIFDKCNEKLHTPEFSVRNLLRKMNIYALYTTNDPVEDLKYHKLLAQEKDLGFKVLPTFRPDNVIKIQFDGFNAYISQLAKASNIEIKSYDDLLSAVENRLDFFNECGCRISDHSLEVVYYEECDKQEADAILKKKLAGEAITFDEIKKFQGYTMTKLGQMYSKRGMVMQLHLGAYRDPNSRAFNNFGANNGYDCVDDKCIMEPLSKILNSMESTGELPKTVLYTLSDGKNDILPVLAGSFQDGTVRGKVQFGSAWWFQNHIMGMEKQMEYLASTGMLSAFIGMLTDSRSFLSFPRHEYFRRILCNLVGEKVENGEFPRDMEYLCNMVKDISFNNAMNYIEN